MMTPSILETLYTECEGYLELRALGAKKAREFFRLSDKPAIKSFLHQHRQSDLYFAVATRDGSSGAKSGVINVPAVWIDIDFKTVAGGETEAMKNLSEFPLQPTIRVLSGGGVHCYWKLKEPSDLQDQEKLEAIMRGLAHRLNGDPACCEIGRILRVPNTLNHKYKPPRKVILEHCNGTEFSLSDFDDFVDYVPTSEKQKFPGSQKNLNKIMECSFMQHCKVDVATLPEPQWRIMITQLMKEPGGVELIHCLSQGYPKYKKHETDRKILSQINSTGPITCREIKKLWDCHKTCKVNAPAALALKSENVTSVTSVTNVTLSPNVTECNQNVTENVTSVTESEDAIISQVRNWLEFCDGVFSIKDLAQELQLYNNKRVYNNLKAILKRLVDSHVIERIGDNRGIYRKVERTLKRMNLRDVEAEEFDIVLPLGITDLVKIYPKNIIVVAGERNTAKTLFSLWLAKANMHHKTVHYFNSEMDGTELKTRLMLFDDTNFSDWDRVNFYERTSNFHDCIFPDDVNIIDYLEIHDEFYKMGGWIRQIHDALGTGIAIINIQKKSGQDMGRGGEVTSEKARLYISLSQLMDPLGRPITRAKIVKCKAPRDHRRHPHGLVRDFRIHRGWDIEPIGDWGPEQQGR